MSPEDRERLKAKAAAHYWPPRELAGDVSEESGVTVMARGEGIWVEDISGRRYIDVVSGLWVSNVGHGRNEVASAVAEQMRRLSFAPAHAVSVPTLELASRLASTWHDPAARVIFSSGGSEAVETAVKLAKQYHRNQGQGSRYKIISRRGSLHGGSFALLGLGSVRGPGAGAPVDFGPLPFMGPVVQGVNPKRCGFCGEGGVCHAACADDIERVIEQEGPSTIAALIAEPISLTGGWHVPPKAYWKTLRELCDRHGILLIADEVLTGMGRTGRWFAMEHFDTKPDIAVLAKGLAGGYAPIGACLVRRNVSDAFAGSDEKKFDHIFTFGGNAMACTAALSVMDIIESEGLLAHSLTQGARLLRGVEAMKGHACVGAVRGGPGLMVVVEFVDPGTGKPVVRSPAFTARLTQAMRRHGLYGRTTRSLSLAPPLSITPGEVDELLQRVDETLRTLSTTP